MAHLRKSNSLLLGMQSREAEVPDNAEAPTKGVAFSLDRHPRGLFDARGKAFLAAGRGGGVAGCAEARGERGNGRGR
jgi:hypothetical protein